MADQKIQYQGLLSTEPPAKKSRFTLTNIVLLFGIAICCGAYGMNCSFGSGWYKSSSSSSSSSSSGNVRTETKVCVDSGFGRECVQVNVPENVYSAFSNNYKPFMQNLQNEVTLSNLEVNQETVQNKLQQYLNSIQNKNNVRGRRPSSSQQQSSSDVPPECRASSQARSGSSHASSNGQTGPQRDDYKKFNCVCTTVLSSDRDKDGTLRSQSKTTCKANTV